ncbi:stage II sporulation protein E [Heyndrickxia ginsengihumi]|uniref:Stage II sporulation protein E n=1 Tax=Heyndrickxia ginsengihumi TaxID=363870 RepID=A0A0A6XY23_9BACI|nr:stage II sporulation protein E [Heyndrickxia ginsengihumi]KHD85032.1 stage II sporulation protein E [Heyndrickxia ginsengihumi]MBE6183231.1 stage II sporulation protein E [Bacillus sp. (in: firmicutes)]MCM3024339.1 stage II sporulation protein E [Heyndrickxia ginsengihumi]NEY21141.1 stage II sporulation protein E [Heyndrickxia ginsengihumi]
MEKVENSLIEPGSSVDLRETKMEVSKGFRQLQAQLEHIFLHKGISLLIVGFLLGRALILSHLTPFSLPFFASVYVMKRNHSPMALLGLVVGALTISISNGVYTFASIFIFLIVFRLFSRFHKDELKVLPHYVLAVSFLSKCTYTYIEQSFHFTLYDGLMTAVEAGLTFVLALIFMQSIPILAQTKRKRTFKTEEVISLIIMLASVLTGTIGWSLYDLSVEHILSRYLVLIFAFVGGATVGSTVGVVTGLIFSLANVTSFYQMSLLAFAGLLSGLLKEGKRFGAAIGLFIATVLIGMYGETNTPLSTNIYETCISILLLFLTPNRIVTKLAKHIPGTAEYTQEQQQYMKKIRDATVQRVEQFSSVFHALSTSFQQYDQLNVEEDEDRELDYFFSNITEKTCQTCFKKEQCWAKNFNQTYDLMKETMHDLEEGNGTVSHRVHMNLEKHCVRAKKVEDAILHELTLFQANQKLKKQIKESRKLVAEQLQGVSEVMGDFAKEIQRERENHQKQEEMILEALQDFGLEIDQVEIYNLEDGNVDIDIALSQYSGYGECEKIIAPMLSDILEETIVVQKQDFSSYPEGLGYVNFRSAKAFVVETGVAHAAKGGGFISGDSYSMIELGSRKYAVAISDGMGNGERAHYESNETLRLLQQILQSGIEEEVAIKSVNSVLALRTQEEVFSTLDLAIIDLQDASSKFLKIGSTPSFIKRGDKVLKIESGNLPMGVLQELDVDVVSQQLKAGDILIMMSDGIFEGPKFVENNEVWIKRKIRELETEDPQEIADLIMEEVIRTRSGLIEDDMTVVVTKIQHNTPKWAAIPVSKGKKLIS